MSANRAVHIPGAGDFLIENIVSAESSQQQPGDDHADRMAQDGSVLATPESDSQDDLARENIPNPLDAEQTWPTEEASLTLSHSSFENSISVLKCS